MASTGTLVKPPCHGGGLSHLVEAASALVTLITGQPRSIHSLETPHGGRQLLISNETPIEELAFDDNAGSALNSRIKRDIFPQRLLAILDDSSLADVITWLPHGRSFVIIRPDVFTEKVLPMYLPPVDARSATKYPSFTRKLNRWGFRQATRGPDTGAFHHPLFRRDKPDLCLEMVCQRTREKKNEKKSSSLPLKKRPPPCGVSCDAPQSDIATLTKESLAAISPSGPAQVSQTTTTVSVSDDSASVVSNSNNSEDCGNNRNASFAVVLKVISSDKAFVDVTLRKQHELERLRVAKAMLYEAYMKALQGGE